MGTETKKKRSSHERKGESRGREVEPACLVSEFSFQFLDVITVIIVLFDVV